jgi:hypothetical protein
VEAGEAVSDEFRENLTRFEQAMGDVRRAFVGSDVRAWEHCLTNAESNELAALLAKVARPHSAEEQRQVELWIRRLSRKPLDHLHGRDLAAS